MAGRTKATKEAAIAAIRKRRGKLYLAAADLGITRQALWGYTRRWPEVREAVAEAKGKMLDVAEDKLFKAIDRGQAWAICFFLKTQGKRRGYVERTEQKLSGDPKAPVLQQGLSDEERLRRIQSLAQRVLSRRAAAADPGGAPGAGFSANGQSAA